MIFMDFYIFLFLKTTLHKGAIALFNSSPHQESLSSLLISVREKSLPKRRPALLLLQGEVFLLQILN